MKGSEKQFTFIFTYRVFKKNVKYDDSPRSLLLIYKIYHHGQTIMRGLQLRHCAKFQIISYNYFENIEKNPILFQNTRKRNISGSRFLIVFTCSIIWILQHYTNRRNWKYDNGNTHDIDKYKSIISSKLRKAVRTIKIEEQPLEQVSAQDGKVNLKIFHESKKPSNITKTNKITEQRWGYNKYLGKAAEKTKWDQERSENIKQLNQKSIATKIERWYEWDWYGHIVWLTQ